MKRDTWTKWRAALLSGNYKQGRSSLHNTEFDTYCCLGVLVKEMTGDARCPNLTNDDELSVAGRLTFGISDRAETNFILRNDGGGVYTGRPHTFAQIVAAVEAGEVPGFTIED